MIAVDAGGENQIIVVSGANASAAAAQLPPMEPGDWLVTQNEVDWTQTAQAHRLAREQGAGVIHNTAPAHGLSGAELARIDVLVANEHELAQAAASAAETAAHAQARSLLAAGVGAVVLTLGAKGSALYTGAEEATAIPAAPAEVRDTTGASDAFVGALAAALAADQSLPGAVASANRYAARVCGFSARKPRSIRSARREKSPRFPAAPAWSPRSKSDRAATGRAAAPRPVHRDPAQ